MHIPDSVLSPITCVAAGVAMAPVWSVAARRVRSTLGTRQMPLLALGAAFCFTIMMFNLPAPLGTTAHPVAGTLLAILLGPWAACLGISVAVLIQALFFGDGGLIAYGANCLTMAFVLPFTGYAVYKLLGRLVGGSGSAAGRAAFGAFVGINAAALAVAVLLGIQPALFHEANGHALYFPFGLNVTVPAMLLMHLVVAGPAEAIVTALVVRYLQSAGIPLYGQSPETARQELSGGNSGGDRLASSESAAPSPRPLFQRQRGLWLGLLILALITPLGLLAGGDAWGEWDAKSIGQETERHFGKGRGYIPKALDATEARGFHGVPGLQDYASGDGTNRVGYIGAGFLGIVTIGGIVLAGGRAITRRSPDPVARSEDSAETPPALARAANAAPPESGPHAGDDLPAWLRAAPGTGIPLPISSSKQNPFVGRTLAEFAAAASASLQLERRAGARGLLQRLDARSKVVTLVLLILVAGLTRRPVVLVSLYGFALALGLASRLPLGLMLRRVWLAVPLFVAAVALPVALTTVTPGREIVPLWGSPRIGISQPGALLAAVLTLRVATAVTFALLLTWTTRWSDLLHALRALRAPRMFLSVLAMTYRYIAVTLQMAADAFTARRSRTVGAASDLEGRKFVGRSVGALFGKSLAMAEEVHAAMLSRGFHGEMRTLAHTKWQTADTLWTLALVAVAVVAWMQG